MPSFSQQYVNKASVITPNGFQSTAALAREEADRFIDYVVDQSFMKSNARVERMNAPTKTIAKIGIGDHILKPAKSAVDPGNTVSITTDQLSLETKEIIAIAEIADDSLEDNIEGDAFIDHLMKMIAAQAANELDLMCMYGEKIPNPNSATDIMQLVDGWITRARKQGHVIDARQQNTFRDPTVFNTHEVNSAVTPPANTFFDNYGYLYPDKLSKVVKTLPNKYRANKSNLRFYLPDDISQDYNDFLGARNMGSADAYMLGVGNLTYSNIPLQSVALMPTDLPVLSSDGANTTLTEAVLIGTNTIKVADATGITAGADLILGYGTGYKEVVHVFSVTESTITLQNKLQYPHVSGETVKACTLNGADLLLTDARNLIFGIQRDIKWETERHARRRSTSFVLTMRVDTQIENEDALVLLNNLRTK